MNKQTLYNQLTWKRFNICRFLRQSAYGTSSYLVTRSSCKGTYDKIRHFCTIHNGFNLTRLRYCITAIR